MGWAVGHGYVCYSPLLHRNTSIVFEGKPAGTPDAGQFSRVIAENQVKGFFLAPTGLRFLKREDPNFEQGSKYPSNSLKAIFVGGERCDNSTKEWASHHFKVPILDHWWQTETAHPMTGHCIGLGNTLNPPKDSTGRPVPGFDIRVVDENGKNVANGEMGRIVCKLPIAPGCLSTLYGNDEGFVGTYFSRFPGFYDTMDAGVIESNGYVKVLARDDDVINVAGHRLSISRLEEVLISHPDVVDCAVVGVRDELKGQIPIGLIVLKKHFHQEDLSSLKEELVQQVRSNVGAVAALKILLSVNNLPRTRSGKITRKCIADMAMGLSIKIPATIEDATVFDEIRQVLVENLNLDIPSPQ
uniref:Acyl-CoA synthetase short-chain family member 3, mitochondrial n=2 Tax=Lepeophtheirus salmonis TaxID=72036 RepID=A0A0K2UBP5_LEPSM